MKRFFQTIQNIWKIEDLRQRILYTLGLIFVYRVGSYIVLPGVDPVQLESVTQQGAKGIFGLLDIFAGGAFSRASIFALGIMPYISASIVMQLVTLAIPTFQKMQKEGESGRRKINNITRWLTVIITAAQASGYVVYLKSGIGANVVISPGLFWISSVVILTAGTIFIMWMGEKITDRGIGNGISLLIMV
ncbi:MAG TPA: preprotein translocase subunit SecY, partial [Chitinophagales bacterium]|nr:preprotein translocase subunit SecY [Chitinophagales bacterium]